MSGWRNNILTKTMRGVGVFAGLLSAAAFASAQVRTTSGMVEGSTSADGKVQIFKGIPYAAPPVGDLRWKEPQPTPQMGGRPEGDGIWGAVQAGANLRRYGFSRQRAERRLLAPECVDSRGEGRRERFR